MSVGATVLLVAIFGEFNRNNSYLLVSLLSINNIVT